MRIVKGERERKEEILDVSFKLFIEKGYIHTTTQDIIDRCDISRGLLYYHFKNKEDILYHLVERHCQPLLSKLNEICYDINLSTLEKLNNFLDATFVSIDTVTEESKQLQYIVDIEENRYLMDKFCHRILQELVQYFAHIIKEGTEQGIFEVQHPLEMAEFLMTGYVFVSNDLGLSRLDIYKAKDYLETFQVLLSRSLNIHYDLIKRE